MIKIISLLMLLNICISAQQLGYMYFLSEDIGWIQTIDSVYNAVNSFRTTNGGRTWTQLDLLYNYVSIDFVNDHIGFLLSLKYRGGDWRGRGAGITLFKTIDKGATWKLIADSLKPFIRVKFIDEMNAYAITNEGIYKTTDSGKNWYKVKDGGFLYEFDVITKYKVIAIDVDNRVAYITNNGGVSWEKKSFINNPYYIQFTDSLNGFVTTSANDPQSGNHTGIRHTTDGGETWNYIFTGLYGPFSMKDSLNGIMHTGSGYWLTNDGFKSYTFKLANLKTKDFFFYSCEAFYACGDSGYFAKSTDCGDTWTEIPFNVLNPTGLNESPSIIAKYSLSQNYPNPFNPSTKIKYSIAGTQMVTLRVYDILGNEVTSLVNEIKQPGTYEVTFDGAKLSSGIYFYKLTSGPFTQTRKFVLLK